MRAGAIDQFGGPEFVRTQIMPVPEVGPEDVLVRIEVAGVASWDAVEREGKYDGMFGHPSKFPYVLGWEGAGTVAAVGAQVSRLKEGERVYSAFLPVPRGGFYAEYVVVNAEHVAHVPEELTIEQAGVVAWDALTGLSGLELLNLKPGGTLMIFGAGGGIGHLAVQLAKRMGVRVLAVASGDDGVVLAKELGADAVVNGRKEDVVAAVRAFAPDGLDAALVTAGGETTERALSAVREGGRISCPHGIMPEPKDRPGLSRYNGDITQVGFNKLNRLIETGPLVVHIAAIYPLDQAAEAHRMLGTHYLGKIALRVR
jgi:NADPH:quinone reductase-like Zn-dependent oxidoreductase